MLRTCMPEACLCVEPQHYPIAYIGARYACFVESNSEVAVILPSGQLIHVSHDAFLVVGFHPGGAAETKRADYFHV
jgi:glutamine amidotransferase PdxT